MRKIIDGKVYDTEKATFMGGLSMGNKEDRFCNNMYLFQTETGELFLYTKSRSDGEDIVLWGDKD